MKKIEMGFTLLELIIVVAITFVLGIIAVPFYSNFFTQNAVSNTTDQLAGELRKAQLYSMIGKQNSNWGVEYANNLITLYKGASYASRTTAFDETFSVPSIVSVSGSGTSITQDATSISANGGNTTTLTWNHTIGNGNNTILIVGLVTNNTTTFTGVTWNTNQALTHLGSTVNCPTVVFSPGCHVDLWYLLSPVANTHSIVATSNASTSSSGGAVSYTNVSQTTPFGNLNTATGNTSGNQSATVSVVSTSANQIVLGVLGSDNTSANGTGTLLWNDHFIFFSMGESKPGTGGSVSMDWSVNSGDWGAIGVPLNPAPSNTIDINFSRMTGTPSAASTMTITGNTNTRTITLTAQGVINK